MVWTNAIDHIFVFFPWELCVEAHRIHPRHYSRQCAVADGSSDCSSVEDYFVANFVSKMARSLLAFHGYFNNRQVRSPLFVLHVRILLSYFLIGDLCDHRV